MSLHETEDDTPDITKNITPDIHLAYAACARRAGAHPRIRQRLYEAGVCEAAAFEIRRRRCGLFFGVARVRAHGGNAGGGIDDNRAGNDPANHHDGDREFPPPLFDMLDEAEAGGGWAVVLPETRRQRIVDLVAFAPARPRRIATWSGLAQFLGEEEVERRTLLGGELRLYEDPLQWLVSGGRGAVALDFSRPLWLPAGARVIVPSLALGKRVRASFEPKPALPELLVAEHRP